MYDKIYNSATGRWVKTNGKVGKQIISKMIGGASVGLDAHELNTDNSYLDDCSQFNPPPTRSPLHQWNSDNLEHFEKKWKNHCREASVRPAQVGLDAHELNTDKSYLNNCNEFNPPPTSSPLHQWNSDNLEHFEEKWKNHCSDKCSRYPGPPDTKSPLHTWNSNQLDGFKKDWQNDCCDTFHAPPNRSPFHQWNTRDIETFKEQWKEDCGRAPRGGGNQSAGATLREDPMILERQYYEQLSEHMGKYVRIPAPKSKLHQHNSAKIEAYKQGAVEAVLGTKKEFDAKLVSDINFAKGIEALVHALVQAHTIVLPDGVRP